MSFICKHCNKEYSSQSSRSNHIKIYHSTEIDKKSASTHQHKISKISSLKKEEAGEFKCKNCDKNYNHYQSKWRHEKDCKVKKIEIDDKDFKIKKIEEEFSEYKKQMEAQREKDKEDFKNLLQKSLKIHPKTLNKINNQLNNNGTINNITIIQLGQENLSEILNTRQKKNILNRQAMSLNDLVDLVHVSGKYKEFQNVYITNLQSTFAYKFDEKANKFIAVNKNELLNDLVDSRMYDIEKFYEEICPDLEPHRAEQIKRFIDRMGDEEDELKGIKKEEIKLILYNNKDKIMPKDDIIV